MLSKRVSSRPIRYAIHRSLPRSTATSAAIITNMNANSSGVHNSGPSTLSPLRQQQQQPWSWQSAMAFSTRFSSLHYRAMSNVLRDKNDGKKEEDEEDVDVAAEEDDVDVNNNDNDDDVKDIVEDEEGDYLLKEDVAGEEKEEGEENEQEEDHEKQEIDESKTTVDSSSLTPFGGGLMGGAGSRFSGGGPSDVQSFFSTPTPPIVEVVPMYKKPVFPGTIVPVIIHDQMFLNQMLKHGAEDKLVGLFLVKEEERSKEGSINVNNVNQIEKVGVLARVTRVYPSKLGASVVFAAVRRIRVTDVVTETAQLTVKIEEFKEDPYSRDNQVLKAYVMEVIATLKELASLNPFHKDQLSLFIDQLDFSDPADLADVAALLTTPDASKLQEVLETKDIEQRIRKSLLLLKKELETIKIQSKIQKNLEEKVNATQRKFYLNEQLKLIKKELGLEHDEKEALIQKYQERLADKKLPEDAEKVIKDEINKLQTLEPSSSEYNVCRNYLDWMTVLPWGVYKPETFNIKKASKILDEDHYGLKLLKDRILEFVAVGSLKGTVQGKIICFVGPPGTGKTSIGKSIARSLDREFYRFSVGGMSDVAEIKGHRRTYVGAMPGKLMQVMKLAKSSNPVIMIDEIDKLGRGHGDPASALLEVLDPEQNHAFLDHYVDVPFDLSKVLFICTSNTLDTIPRPLLDRMEVLRLSGYILEEKVNIAKKYLLPKVSEDTGIKKNRISIPDRSLEKMIREYCREAGVRNLQHQVEKLYRKVAFKIASGHKGKITIKEDDIEEYLGKPKFTSDRFYMTTPIGVTMGLAWTEMGGSTLYIETQIVSRSLRKIQQSQQKLHGEEAQPVIVDDINNDNNNKEENDDRRQGTLIRTGKMGEVMQESTTIAYTYSKRFTYDLDPTNDFFDKTSIHMHIPEGATPKDGPSAGVTMVTSLLSLALNKPVKHNLAMTGELTLTGRVLEIGGLKEKIIAAKRSGVTEVVVPRDNKKDWVELEPEIREGVTANFASDYADVYRIAFEYDEKENAKNIAADKEKFEQQAKEAEKPRRKSRSSS